MIPAPGTYNPEKPEHTPNYSFGLKTPLGKPSDTPGKYLFLKHINFKRHIFFV